MPDEKGLAIVSFGGQDVLQFIPHGASTKYFKGQTIFRPTPIRDPEPKVFLITKGAVAIAITRDDGTTINLALRATMDLIGDESLVAKPFSTSAICLTKTVEACSYKVKDLVDIAARNPNLNKALAGLQTNRVLEQNVRMAMSYKMKIPRKLAAILCLFAGRVGGPQPPGEDWEPPEEVDESIGEQLLHEIREKPGAMYLPGAICIHEQLAAFIGTSREIVTHYMNMFRRIGWLDYTRKLVIINDIQTMMSFAGGKLKLPADAMPSPNKYKLSQAKQP